MAGFPSSSSSVSRPEIRFSPRFWVLARWIVMLLSVFSALYLTTVYFGSHWNRTDRERDLTIYYDALDRWREGVSLYKVVAFEPTQTPFEFFYPPSFLVVLAPLRGLDYIEFARFWHVMLFAMFWLYAACLGRIVMRRWNLKSALLGGLAVVLFPLSYRVLSLGNFEAAMWASYGVAVVLALSPKREKAVWSVVPLAFAALMKLHPVWAVAAVARVFGTRAVFLAAIVFVAGAGAGVALVGWEDALRWLPATSPVVSQGTWNTDNWSLSFAVLRLADALGWTPPDGPFPPLVRAYLSAMTLLGPLVTFVLARRQSVAMQVALLAAATILFAPLCWSFYFPTLLLMPAVWWHERQSASASSNVARNTQTVAVEPEVSISAR